MSKFKALDNNSQMSVEQVLFFNKEASPQAIFECIYSRLEAVAKLHNELTFIYNDKVENKPFSEISSLLLSDVLSMYRIIGEHASELTSTRNEIDQYKKTIAMLSRAAAVEHDDSTTEGE
ncbi:hypothetical protein GUD16_003321 [Salmonella enterica]|nr:hypothetical protein [Salmonella enterica]